MKLWVDDRREAPEGWTRVKSITEAIRALDQFGFTDVSLDHDICHEYERRHIGNEYEQDYFTTEKLACNENFSAVAFYIIAADLTPKVTIHTTNRDGALNMQAILARGGIVAVWTPATF